MKNIILIAFYSISLMACQQKHDGYVVHGNIAGNSDGMKVQLVDQSVYPPVVLDSTVIKNGKFEFKGKLELPGRYQVIIDKTGEGDESEMLASSFYLENSDITYSGHVDSLKTYFWSNETFRKEPVVTGSAMQDLYNQYRKKNRELHNKMADINEKYLEVYHRPAMDGIFNTEEGIALSKQLEQLGQQSDATQWKFIEQYPGTIVAYDMASEFLEGMYVSLTIPQIDQLAETITKAWGAYPDKAAEFKAKAEKAKKMALGTKYQDIELMNTEGKMVKLSEYVPEGRYVMLEFWASWCGPCRGEIPHLRHVYSEYKDKGFEIVSISVDQKKTDWEKAMKEENMVWKQLCDPKGFNGPVAKTYNITGVPTCILLDKEGHIFKTEMRGAALDAVLQELYGQPTK